MITLYANYGESKVKLTWKKDCTLPEYEKITSVHGFCFYEDKVLLIEHQKRGWNFPGGHIEEGEIPEECFKREVLEEGYVQGECTLLGYIIVDHHDNPNWNKNSLYPKVGYQPFYRMEINEIHEFRGEYESDNRMFVSVEEITSHYHKWNELYDEILKEAIAIK
ncbi:NUDIX hydrolase [Bacillus luti]|uniref:NUDIX domain-containing protein n=1 Tax=Bacillus luti TaxID=2026191 RepID=A0A7V7S450_9BACI|nr:NUDIX domain-containing protein [Bacillus luti]KAB2440886.1 NUDIX domain-containing protein [Bacillus luti]